MENKGRKIIGDLEEFSHLLPNPFYWLDLNQYYLGVNAYTIEVTGTESFEKDFSGKTPRDLYPKEMAEEIVEHHREVISTGQILRVEESIKDVTDKKTKFFAATIAPLLDDQHNIIGTYGISTEITKEKRLTEDLRVASASKSEFLSNMSHDLRTPISGALAIVRSLVYTCKEASRSLQSPLGLTEAKKTKLLKDLTERGQEYGTIAQRAIQEVSDLCDEILDTIRLESGQAKTTPKSFNLQALVDRTITLLKPVAEERQLNLSAEIDAKVPHYLTGLGHYLNRILLNLMGNGLKFTEKGGVLVRVRLSEQLEKPLLPGGLVTLIVTVEDTGIGIPQEKFETVFEHFSRLTPSYQGIYKGAGLGLYSVKQYVAAMKSQIEVSSEVGEGSCFTLTVPMIVACEDEVGKDAQHVSCEEQQSIQKELTSTPPLEEEGPPEAAAPSSEQTMSREGKAPIRIMLVEDNPMLAHATAMSLQPLRWIVDRVGDGETAVEKVQQAHYDMIFMDIGLPKMDGIETTACIRALPNPEYAQVPIVAVTGHAREDHYEECMAAGMNEVFRKPLPPALFEEALQRFARKSERSAELIAPLAEPESIVIDWEGTIQACDNDKDHVNELLDIFMDNFAETERVLETAYRHHDIKTLEYRLHYTISVFYYLRFPQLDQALRALQTVVKITSQDQEALDRTYQATQRAIQAMWKVLKEQRKDALS